MKHKNGSTRRRIRAARDGWMAHKETPMPSETDALCKHIEELAIGREVHRRARELAADVRAAIERLTAERDELRAKLAGIPGWLADMGSGVLDIEHRSGWNEAVGFQENGEVGLYFAFFTLRDAQARNAMALLGAAGLLCETATRQDPKLDEMLRHADLWYAGVTASVVDGLRALTTPEKEGETDG